MYYNFQHTKTVSVVLLFKIFMKIRASKKITGFLNVRLFTLYFNLTLYVKIVGFIN